MLRETVLQALLTMAMLFFAVLVGLVGLGFLTASLYLYLTLWLTPAGAAGATGFLLLLVTLLILSLCRVAVAGPRQPGPLPRGDDPEDKVSGLLKDAEALGRMSRSMEGTLRKHMPVAAGSAFAIGFVLGVNPNARRALADSLSDATFSAMNSGSKGASSTDSC